MKIAGGERKPGDSLPQAANYRPQTVTGSVEYAKGRQRGLFISLSANTKLLACPDWRLEEVYVLE